jgi:vitamin B12 transporter
LEFTQEIIMHQKIITFALFGAIAFPIAASADTSGMEEIVVTAARMPQALDKSIADTTVLNEQDIKKSGAPDVVTLLRSVPGLEITQNGGMGSSSGIYMRGTNPNQVLVLLDGVRIDSATMGTTAIEHIMLDNIERIEIVRGNVSSLYGSEAIGGVIQLFTRQGQGAPAFNASAGVGNQGTQRMSAGFSGAVNDTSFSVNAGRVKTDGVSAMNPLLMPNANPNKNGYDNNTLDAQIKQTINTDHALTASVFSTRGNISFDNPYGLPTDLNNIVENIDKMSLASDDQINDLWHSQVRLSQGIDDSHTFTNGLPTYHFQTRNNQTAWQNNVKIADGQQLSMSVENLNQAVTSTTPYPQTTRNVNSFLGGYVGAFGAQQIQLNLRQDRYSDFGAANTGLLGYGLSFADSWRATASISNAFRAPTFNELYYPGYGSPALMPERSVNREAGLHYAANGQRVDAVYFDNRISDMIIGSTITPFLTVNINQAHIEGQELSYAGDFGNTHLRASATFQNPRDAVTGQLLPRRAKEFGNVGVAHDFGALNLGAEVRYSGARQDGVNTLAAYQLLNLTARYQIDKSWNLSARAGNLFNRSYSEVYGYNTPGRTLFVSLSYQQ